MLAENDGEGVADGKTNYYIILEKSEKTLIKIVKRSLTLQLHS